MRILRPSLSQAEMLRTLSEQEIQLGPFHLALEEHARQFDGVLRAYWPARKIERRFVIQCEAEWSRRAVERSVERLNRTPLAHPPLLVFPYLSEQALEDLQARGVSGLDLCGNGLLFDPPLFVLRTGVKPSFRTSPGDYSVYLSSNIASLVPRVFLLQPRFFTAKAVMEACHARMSPLEGHTQPLVLPTVSKALSQLKRDLVVNQKGRQLSLRDPDRLLTELYRSFRPPMTLDFVGKTSLSLEAVWSKLRQLRRRARAVMTGKGSAALYTGLAGPDRLRLYVSDLHLVRDVLEARPTQVYPNIELLQTDEESVWFDARDHDGALWSSPIQAYLELTQGSAREVDVAQELRARLLSDVAAALQSPANWRSQP